MKNTKQRWNEKKKCCALVVTLSHSLDACCYCAEPYGLYRQYVYKYSMHKRTHTICHSPNTKNLTLSIYWEPIYDSHNSHDELFFFIVSVVELWMCVRGEPALTPIVNLTALCEHTFPLFSGKNLVMIKILFIRMTHIKTHYKRWAFALFRAYLHKHCQHLFAKWWCRWWWWWRRWRYPSIACWRTSV